jgi:hypothetical protein
MVATRPWVLVEMFEAYKRRFGASCAELDGFLVERGYQGYQLHEAKGGHGGLRLTRLDLAGLDQVNNVLHAPASRVHLLPTTWLEG